MFQTLLSGVAPRRFLDPARSSRRFLPLKIGPFVALLALVVTAQPVTANCTATVAAFPPGHWVAQGITLRAENTDRRSVTVVDGTGGFEVTIDEFGEVTGGSISIAGNGFSQSWVEGDDTSSEASYIKSGRLSGTSTHLEIEGEIDLQMSGAIDVAPGGDGDPIRPGGDDMIAFENSITVDWTGSIAASGANCNQVFGSLDGPVDADTAYDGNESFFLAVRTGPKAASLDIQGKLADLLGQAEVVLNMDPVDTDVLVVFLRDMLAFDSLLASLESCDAGDEQFERGPTWAMLQSVMLNTMRTFLNAADAGAYGTAAVIGAMTVWIQGGSLGWRADGCLDDSAAGDGVVDVFLKFEDVLLERLLAATNVGDPELPLNDTDPEAKAADDEIRLIYAAAYQFGLPRVIDAQGGTR